ncbi:hypothetical protein [Dankookia sp. P2]|uniref:hypothetical protein n=1 Tax=Dankookia sp. P2 TaxID=3423955 RepID=UPI003D67E333
MAEQVEVDVLPLREALVKWADPSLVEAVKAEERRMTANQIGDLFHYSLLSDPGDLRKISPNEWLMAQPDYDPLFSAWKRLKRDLIARLNQERLFVRGVPIKPARGTRHEPLPGVWAASFEMNFDDNTITIDEALYGAVEVSEVKFASSSLGQDRSGTSPGHKADQDHGYGGPAGGSTVPAISYSSEAIAERVLQQITPEQAATLLPDTVAALLEAHAEHVRVGLRVELAPPGKASPLALAASMMKHRAITGALRPTLTEETDCLEDWLKKSAPSYSPLGSKRMQNALGSLYRTLLDEHRQKVALPAAEGD